MIRRPKAAERPGAVIARVRPGSIAAEAGLRPGDVIDAVNGQPASDIIQLHFAAAAPRLTLAVRHPDGSLEQLELEKDEEEDLGLAFQDPLFDRILTCVNKCVFCFVHQNPKGLRRSLYVMDDDLRLSVLDGDFITLTNWTEQDWQRVLEQHLSPLYVSVHSTEDDLRAYLMGTDRARGIMGQLRRLADAGIQLHTQLVLCPGINDGPHLDRSIQDLAGLYPQVRTISVVPVGLTRFRRAGSLRCYRPDEARDVLCQVHRWQRHWLAALGTRLVFAADEWYTLAGRPVPGAAAYEGYPQLSNGVGMLRKLMDEAAQASRRLPRRLPQRRRVLWVTGRSAAPTLERIAGWLRRRVPNLEVTVQAVENRFWGPTVTVAGLLTATDLREQLTARRDLRAFDAVLLPDVVLRRDAPVFLDDVTLDQLRAATTPALQVLPVSGRQLVRATLGPAAAPPQSMGT